MQELFEWIQIIPMVVTTYNKNIVSLQKYICQHLSRSKISAKCLSASTNKRLALLQLIQHIYRFARFCSQSYCFSQSSEQQNIMHQTIPQKHHTVHQHMRFLGSRRHEKVVRFNAKYWQVLLGKYALCETKELSNKY
jgi:hypothetical protein